MQPLDLSVFGPLKSLYNTECAVWKRDHPTDTFNKSTLTTVIGKIWDNVMKTTTIQNGFKAAGIYPYDRTKIKEEHYLPSIIFTSHPTTISIPPSPGTSSPTSSPLIQININMSPPTPTTSVPTSAVAKIKVDTKYSTFLTHDNIIQQLQKQKEQKLQEEQEVRQRYPVMWTWIVTAGRRKGRSGGGGPNFAFLPFLHGKMHEKMMSFITCKGLY